ncbi:MAG TPA: L-aspartate oxidase [Planctomycetota bacterium]|nr:L-aspartate oxidase [Planctomycetota bacterium]
MMKSPEYLVSFDTNKLPSFITDVLVIGSGMAGLRAAIESAKTHNVILASKNSLSESNTYYAQGGIASQIDKPKLIPSHIADTIEHSYGLSDPDIVKEIISRGIPLVKELISWGLKFDSKSNGPDMTLEGGHKLARILHSGGDATGKNIHASLLQKVKSISQITALDYTFVIDILITPGKPNDCSGAVVFSQKTKQVSIIWAKKTIIASGGAGQLYRESTNPDVTTGDGLSIAYRKGAKLQDLEFIQFHPTALYVAGASRFLISESVRGEGGLLRDKLGKRFMPDYHPLAELAPRDIVSRAIINQMKLTKDTNVYLDLTHLSATFIEKRFPSMSKLCRDFGIDVKKDMIPVRPSAHYMVGGIKIDLRGHTNIKNLFAAGEAASVSFHGANRLGSNSLLESLVIGHLAGATASSEISSARPVVPIHIDYKIKVETNNHKTSLDLADIKNSLQSLMWYNVGLECNALGLNQALEKIDYWSSYCLAQEFSTPQGWEVQNMLTLSRLVTQSALLRQESRGVHYRTDFPKTEEKWNKHTIV